MCEKNIKIYILDSLLESRNILFIIEIIAMQWKIFNNKKHICMFLRQFLTVCVDLSNPDIKKHIQFQLQHYFALDRIQGTNCKYCNGGKGPRLFKGATRHSFPGTETHDGLEWVPGLAGLHSLRAQTHTHRNTRPIRCHSAARTPTVRFRWRYCWHVLSGQRAPDSPSAWAGWRSSGPVSGLARSHLSRWASALASADREWWWAQQQQPQQPQQSGPNADSQCTNIGNRAKIQSN